MKGFKGGTELRITREDLIAALEYVINEQILGSSMSAHVVDSVTLHPDAKYVARISISKGQR